MIRYLTVVWFVLLAHTVVPAQSPEPGRHILFKSYPTRWLWQTLLSYGQLSLVDLDGISAEIAPAKWISLEVEPVFSRWAPRAYPISGQFEWHYGSMDPEADHRKLFLRSSVHIYPVQLLKRSQGYTAFQHFYAGYSYMRGMKEFDAFVIQRYETYDLESKQWFKLKNGEARVVSAALKLGYGQWLHQKQRLHWSITLMLGRTICRYTYTDFERNMHAPFTPPESFSRPLIRLGGTFGYAF